MRNIAENAQKKYKKSGREKVHSDLEIKKKVTFQTNFKNVT